MSVISSVGNRKENIPFVTRNGVVHVGIMGLEAVWRGVAPGVELNDVATMANLAGIGATTKIFSGAGTPTDVLYPTAATGDFVINTTNGGLYKRTGVNTYTFQFSMIGPAGANGTNGTNGTNGSSMLSTTGVPGSGLGVNGDLCINELGDIYLKTGGSWVFQFSLGTSGTFILTDLATIQSDITNGLVTADHYIIQSDFSMLDGSTENLFMTTGANTNALNPQGVFRHHNLGRNFPCTLQIEDSYIMFHEIYDPQWRNHAIGPMTSTEWQYLFFTGEGRFKDNTIYDVTAFAPTAKSCEIIESVFERGITYGFTGGGSNVILTRCHFKEKSNGTIEDNSVLRRVHVQYPAELNNTSQYPSQNDRYHCLGRQANCIYDVIANYDIGPSEITVYIPSGMASGIINLTGIAANHDKLKEMIGGVVDGYYRIMPASSTGNGIRIDSSSVSTTMAWNPGTMIDVQDTGYDYVEVVKMRDIGAVDIEFVFHAAKYT